MYEGIEGREETMTRGKHRERKTERLREREIRRESWGRGGREGRETGRSSDAGTLFG